MRVTQTISIGSLRINSMSNSAFLQVGTSGAIKARSEDIKEYTTPAQSDKKIESKITKELKPHFKKEGLPLEDMEGAGGTSGAGGGGASGASGAATQHMNPTADGYNIG